MVDMTETTPGVPLRSPLSDVPPFSIYLALSFSLSLTILRTSRSFSRFPSSTFLSLPRRNQLVFTKRVRRLIIFNHIEY